MAKGSDARVRIVGEDKTAAAFRSAEGGLKKLQSAAGITRAALAGTLGGVGFAAGAATFVASLRSISDELDSLAKRARSAGLTVEQLSGLEYVFELSGLSAQETSRTFAVFATRLQDIERGTGRAAEAANALGIELTDANGRAKTSADVFADIADKISRFEDGANKTALAAALFGEELGPRLVSALNLGRDGIQRTLEEAANLGFVIDTQATDAAEKFNDQLSKLQRSGGAVLRDFLLPSIEFFARVAEKFNEARAAGEGFVGSIGAAAGAAQLPGELIDLIERGEAIRRRIAKIEAGDLAASEERLAAERARLAVIEAEIVEKRKLLDIPAPPVPTQSQDGGQAPALVDPAVQKAAERYLEQLQARIDKTQELTAVEQLNADLARGKVKLDEAQAEQARALAQQIDSLARAQEAQKAAQAKFDAGDRYLEALQKQILATQDLTAVERLNAEIAAGTLAFKTGASKVAAQAAAAELDATRAAAAEADQALKRAQEQARASEREAQEIAGLRDRYLDLIDPLRQYRQQLEEVERLRALGGASGLTEEQARRAIAAIHAQAMGIEEVVDAADRAENSMRDMFAPVKAEFEDVLFESQKLSDAFKQLAIDFAKLFVRRQLNSALDFLAQSAGSLFGGAPIDRSRDTPAGGSFNGLRTGGGLTVNVQSGVSYALTSKAVSDGVKVAQGQMLDSRVRGGAFAQ